MWSMRNLRPKLWKICGESILSGILVHPESPAGVIDLADAVGSTSAIIKAASELPEQRIYRGDGSGIFHKLRQLNPDKVFIEAPTAGDGATCRSCAHRPWMAMNELQCLNRVPGDASYRVQNAIHIDPAIAERASCRWINVGIQRLAILASVWGAQVLNALS